MDSRFSLLLHSGRMALATNKYPNEIDDTEEMEIELKIKINEIGLIIPYINYLMIYLLHF